MVNEMYVEWLVTWIKNATINISTGKAFTIDDIKNADYKTAIQAKLTT
jgi:hypothetical protein